MRKNILNFMQETMSYELTAKSYCILILCLVCLILPPTAQAAEYYLDAVNGDDANPGTADAPWKTIIRAEPNYTGAGTKVTSGDTVYLKNGQYGRFYMYNYATAGTDWITYQNAPGHEPEIDTIYIYNSTKTNRYIKFRGIYISEHLRELPSPTEPWNHTPTILVNVRRQNYVIMEKLKLQPKNKYLNGQVFLFSECNDVTIQDCNIVDFRQGFYLDICPGIVVRHNRIYNTWNGSIVSTYAGSDNALIELNHIYGGSYDTSNEYFPTSKVYLDPVVFPQTPDPGFVLNEEIWQPEDGSIAKATLVNYRWETNKWVLYVRNNISGYIGVRASYPQTSVVNFTPTSAREDTHRGSALAIRSKYAVIRKNIVHDFFGQGLYFYQNVANGQYGHVVENNIFYDIGNLNNFFHFNGSSVFRNNTFIGYMANTGLNAKDIVQKYNGPISIAYGGEPWYGDFDGTGVRYYNNIFVGVGPFPDPNNEAWNKYEEDYNIVWARYYNGNYEPTSAKGANSKVLVWKDPNTTANYGLHGYPNSFEDIGYRGSTPEYSFSEDGITPFFVNPGFKFFRVVGTGLDADVGSIWDYRLAAGSPGINFGALQVATWEEVLSGQVTGPSQPYDSLGSLGPDGFIRNDGPRRGIDAKGVDHHSVGCYEYSSTSFLYGDVNDDGEISAFDAALAAHIAVDLEHPDIKNRAAAEVSGDAEVTAYDAALIAQKAVGLIDKFPVE